MTKCNQQSVDVNGLFSAIQNECYLLLNDVADRIIKEFQEYIVANGAGRTFWRMNAAAEFKVLSEKITPDLIEMKLGEPENLASEAWHSFVAAQMMVALFGNHGPLYTKPGEITFHNHMEDMNESKAQSVWKLPDGFNWEDPHPEKILANILKTTKTYFQDGVQELLRNINFYDYVYVD